MLRIQSIFGFTCTVIICALLVVACGNNPTIDGGQDNTTPELSFDNINAILEQANTLPPYERTKKFLEITQILLNAGELDWARNTLAQVLPSSVPRALSVKYAVLSAAIAMAQGQPFVAKRYLWDEQIVNLAKQSSTEQQITFHHVRAQLLLSLAEYRASIAERITLAELITDQSQSENNQDLIWQTLMELPYKELMYESQIQDKRIARGWYTLAALSKNNQTNIRMQLQEVENWALNWPEHPASLRYPADLQLLQQLASEQPKQIAILLPMSGKLKPAAKAILDGFMAAYYHASAQGDQVAELRFYDTAKEEDINIVYDTAVNSGAELIIGPLEQEKIAELALRPELPIPTLALNRLSGPLDQALKLFQFGLPLEDEALQVAEQAWKDGHRRALILAPASSNGDRSVVSFSERWQALGGEIISDYRYKDQSSYSDLVKHAVKIKDSEERRREIRQIAGRPIEFEPRRRQDIDFIFLYGNAAQARQLKPILAFHYSGNIPVYAVKDVFNGKQDPKRNKDLNNIRFTTIPWYFESELPEKSTIENHTSSVNFQTLYALGIDAYHIYPRLRQLESIKQAHFYGATGALSIDEKRKVVREQIWAKFINGVAYPTASVTQDEDAG